MTKYSRHGGLPQTRDYGGLPKTYAEALALGLKKYFTGFPCKRGHISDRDMARRCCQCNRATSLAAYYADPKASMQRAKEYAARNPDANYKAHLKRAYGISYEMYVLLLSEQNNKCGICGASDPQSVNNRWHVDHCHTTGKVRGILCRPCNHMLGLAADSPDKLLSGIDYLTGRRAARYSVASSLLSMGS